MFKRSRRVMLNLLLFGFGSSEGVSAEDGLVYFQKPPVDQFTLPGSETSCISFGVHSGGQLMIIADEEMHEKANCSTSWKTMGVLVPIYNMGF